MQLAEVGHPGVCREPWPQLDPALERPLRGAVTAKLDLAVGDHAVVAGDCRVELPCAKAELEAGAEVVPAQREGAEAARRVEVRGIGGERLVELGLCAAVEARFRALADLLEVGEPELGAVLGIVRRRIDGALERRHETVCVGARGACRDVEIGARNREGLRARSKSREDRQRDSEADRDGPQTEKPSPRSAAPGIEAGRRVARQCGVNRHGRAQEPPAGTGAC